MKRKTFRAILISYILMSLVPVIVSIIVYSIAITTVRKQVSDMGDFSALQLKTQTDAILSKVIASAKSLSRDSTLRSLIEVPEEADAAARYEINKLSGQLGGYEQSNDWIRNAFVFMSGSRSILSSTYRYNDDKAEQFAVRELGLGIEELKAIVKNSPRGLIRLKQSQGTPANGNLILFIQPVMSRSYLFQGAVIMTIDAGKLAELSENVVFESGATFLISPERDYYISKAGCGPILWDQVAADNKSVISKLLGYEVYTASSKSDVSEIIYATAIPVDEYYRPIRNIIAFMICYIAICLIFGVIAAYSAARRRYTPIERMLQLISSKQESSEFQAIEQALKNAAEKEKLYERMQAEQNENARNNVLAGLLKRRSGDPDYLSSLLRLHNIDIDLAGSTYAAVTFYIDDYSNLFFGRENIRPDEETRLSFIVIRSIIEELLSPFSKAYAVNIDSSIACIVCFKNDLGDDEAERRLKETLAHAAQFIEENFGLSVLAAVSPLLRSVSELPAGYTYALDAVEYATLIDQRDRCVLYSEVKPDSLNISSGFLMKKRRLLNLLIEGKYSEASDAISDIIDSGLIGRKIGINAMKRRMLMITNLCCEHFDSLKDSLDEENRSMLDPGKALSAVKNAAGLKEATQTYLMAMEQLQSDKECKADNMGARVRAYIDENIRNQDLDITYISDHFDISQSYASRVFKQQTGSTILDYINTKRIEEAKRLLITTKLSVKEISEKVGYRNPWTLTRTLRRIEGLSPVAYRETVTE